MGFRVPEPGLEKGEVLLRRGAIRFIAEYRVGAGHRAEHQAVPGREHLIVAGRAHA